MTEKFWETTPLEKMSDEQWESLCDKCGRCCLHKLQDEETDEVFYTQVACKLLDCESCQCTQYSSRKLIVPNCLDLRKEEKEVYEWLPDTCAYKRIYKGEALEDWHPLISNDPNSVHEAGISVQSYAISEERFDFDDYQDFVIELDK